MTYAVPELLLVGAAQNFVQGQFPYDSRVVGPSPVIHLTCGEDSPEPNTYDDVTEF